MNMQCVGGVWVPNTKGVPQEHSEHPKGGSFLRVGVFFFHNYYLAKLLQWLEWALCLIASNL